MSAGYEELSQAGPSSTHSSEGNNYCAGPSTTLPPVRPPRRTPVPPPRSPSPELSYLRRPPSPGSTTISPGLGTRGSNGIKANGGIREDEGSLAGTAEPVSNSPGRSPRAEGSLGGNKGMKRRPKALDLRSQGDGVRVDPELQGHLDDIASAITVVSDYTSVSDLSDELQDLTALRETVHRNLRDRPVYSPLSAPSTPDTAPPELVASDMTDAAELYDLISSPSPSSPLIIVDTRPLGSFLDGHLPHSANLSIPSLILKRLTRGIGTKMDWSSMATFITTPEGRSVWDGIDPESEVKVIILGTWGWDETARAILPVLREMIPRGKVTMLRGGWEAIEVEESLGALLQGTKIAGPSSNRPSRPSAPLRSATLPHLRQPQTAPSLDVEPTFLLAPPTPPAEVVPRLANQVSMPSLRAKRGQPTLSLQTGNGNGPGKKPPGLSLNVDRPLRSATVGSFPRSPTGLRSPGLLKIDTNMAKDTMPSPQASQFPTSPIHAIPSNPEQPFSAEPEQIPRTPVMTSRHAMSPFIVSTILPGFLFLGPEITNDEDVASLRRMGVKRILNVAMECEDGAGLGLRETFDRYLKIPMRDTVEESGVGKGMRDSCNFLDDARLHDAPTYVHCRAGKSRSVTVVLAYLIHANAWTLKTAYAYVAERRKGISPNIGFVAELMQFEEAELGVKQSGGVHGETEAGVTRNRDIVGQEEDRVNGNNKAKPRNHPRYARESLPPGGSLGALKPGWISSFSTTPDGDKSQVEEKDERKVDEREVRKNGQWVHQRRVPVDKSTLQPGRRASKAGLESLRTLATLSSIQSSPHPSPSAEGRSSTPSADSRVGWI